MAGRNGGLLCREVDRLVENYMLKKMLREQITRLTPSE